MKMKSWSVLLILALALCAGCPTLTDLNKKAKDNPPGDKPLKDNPNDSPPPNKNKPPETDFSFVDNLPSQNKAPDFNLTGLDGKKYQLSALKGKVVVVCFWSITCPHCIKTIPTVDALAKKINNKNVVVLSITGGEAPPVQAKVRELGLKLPVLMDPGYKTFDAYGVEGVPTTFVIAPDGSIERKEVGARDWTSPDLMNDINKLTAK